MRAVDRDILRLALPALGALAAEPIFLLADTAMVGHLGKDALASLALAGVVVQTVLGLMIFLAYATTPRVARFVGAGDLKRAVSAGFDGMWLALVVSVVLVAAGLPLLGPVLRMFDPSPEVFAGALSYVTVSWWGLPFMLIVIAATGLLRGMQDTVTPLVVAAGGFGLNIGLNAVFIYGMGLGVAGSAWGSVLAHAAMCSVYLVFAGRAARRHNASLAPDWSGVLSAAFTSGWLLIRSASLRAALIVLVSVASVMGTVSLAAVQIAQTLFNSLALVLDSLAIAGQAMIGLYVGKDDTQKVHTVKTRLIVWGVGFGVVVGVVLAVVSPFVGRVFTSSPEVVSTVAVLVLILALSMPLAGYVFTLDGILLGASDARYLALAQFGAAAGFALLVWAAMGMSFTISALWACFCFGFMAFRAVGLGARMRGEGWIRRARAVAILDAKQKEH